MIKHATYQSTRADHANGPIGSRVLIRTTGVIKQVQLYTAKPPGSFGNLSFHCKIRFLHQINGVKFLLLVVKLLALKRESFIDLSFR